LGLRQKGYISMLLRIRYLCYSAIVASLICGLPMTTQATDGISLELNTAIQHDSNCRLHFLLSNNTTHTFSDFRIEIAFFDNSGRFVNHATADFLKVGAHKTVMRSFDVPGQQCVHLGKILLNDDAVCISENGAIHECVELIEPTHRTEILFFK